MGNCFVTKLMSTVSNNDLLKLNEIRMEVSAPGLAYFSSIEGKSITISVLSGDILLNGQTSITINDDVNISTPISGTSGVISFSKKNEIFQMHNKTSSGSFDANQLDCCVNLKYFRGIISGKVSKQLNIPAISSLAIIAGSTVEIKLTDLIGSIPDNGIDGSFMLRSPGITGNFADLARILSNQTTRTYNITGTAITGSIKDYVIAKRAQQVAEGQTPEGSVLFEYLEGSKITLEGTTPVTMAAKVVISWDASTISVAYNDGEPIVIN